MGKGCKAANYANASRCPELSLFDNSDDKYIHVCVWNYIDTLGIYTTEFIYN